MEVVATHTPAREVDADVIVRQDRADDEVALAFEDGRWIVRVAEAKDPEQARVAAAKACARAGELRARSVCWELPDGVDRAIVAGVVEGTLLRAYRFERYKPRAPSDTVLERLVVSSPQEIAATLTDAAVLCAAQNRARDLVNTPSNELGPDALASYAAALHGVEAEVMDEEQIRAAGMGAFAAVAQGSREEARLIRLRYEGPNARGPLLGLVGKAVTFDSGGLSLKSPAKMHEMKFDMAGGAAVIEAMAALAELEAPVRVLGIVGATENLPSGSAIKPGDIVRALDGTTIEVNNTDAEGRLVLADCISLARREGCERLVDLATLTGGVLTALGSVYAGLFCNDEEWCSRLREAADVSGEPVWRLPLHPRFARMMKGRYAQLTNHSERREASPVTGAEFLHHFADGCPWAHVDIAGTAYDVPAEYYGDKGATGFGVRLLVELARGAIV